MILEAIVTTVGTAQRVNVAPMGPVLSNPDALSIRIEEVLADTQPPNSGFRDPGFLLRPFAGSRTLANLQATGAATIHVCDDIELFAKAALGRLNASESLTQRLDDRRVVLTNCHQWFAIEATEIREPASNQFPRYEIPCRLVRRGVERTFFGFNRARHAVLEAAILATRIEFLPPDEIRSAFQSLRSPVEKTAGRKEQELFDWICDEVEQRLAMSKERASSR